MGTHEVCYPMSVDDVRCRTQWLEEENFSFDWYTFSLKLQDSTDCLSLCSEPGRNVSPSLDQLIDRSNRTNNVHAPRLVNKSLLPTCLEKCRGKTRKYNKATRLCNQVIY
ncbi:hypothetical protein J6590_037954 [Homalodisca vitripennis]|nr:hypothetical protein J6590_037954 [Homalodisca vitripennis]